MPMKRRIITILAALLLLSGTISAQYSRLGFTGGLSNAAGMPRQNAYGFGVRSGEHQLSMKTCSLLSHLPRLAELGVASVLTDGRESRPEYTALLSDLVSRAIKADKAPPEKDLDVLREAFPTAGESDGYYEGKNDSSLYGWARPSKGKLSAAVRADYRPVGIKLQCAILHMEANEVARVVAERLHTAQSRKQS